MSNSKGNSTFPLVDACFLSPKARAISTIISAGAGSIIGGASNGVDISFHTTWVCYLSSMRIIMCGIWALWEALQLHRVEGGDQFFEFWEKVPVLWHIVKHAKRFDSPFYREDSADPDAPVNLLGWIGWTWSALYEPVTNTLWLVGNWNQPNAALFFARGIGVGISALPLTIDTRARYGDSLQKYLGRPFRWSFVLLTAFSTLYLGLLAATLLVLSMVHWDAPVWKPILVALVYTAFMACWTDGSFVSRVPHDEGNGVRNLDQFFEGLCMGIFGIAFVALPAIIVFFTSPSHPGKNLPEYIKCQPLQLWRKLIAFLP